MKYGNQILSVTLGGAALVVLSVSMPAMAATNAPDARLEAFLNDVERMMRDSSQTTQEAVESLLTQSFELGRPQAAAAIAKSYLARHRDPSLTLLVKAAQVAEWSGDLRTAVGRYKQALKFGIEVTNSNIFNVTVDNPSNSSPVYVLSNTVPWVNIYGNTVPWANNALTIIPWGFGLGYYLYKSDAQQWGKYIGLTITSGYGNFVINTIETEYELRARF